MAAVVPAGVAERTAVKIAPARSRATPWTAWLRPLADVFLPVTILRGRSRETGAAASVVVAGALSRVGWLVEHFFAAPPARESLGHVPAWRLARMMRRQGASADLAIARVARTSARALGFDDDWLPVPDWVGTRLVAPFDLQAIAQRSHSIADDFRKLRRSGCTAEITRQAGDLAAFHRDYYLPFLLQRHREDAMVTSVRRMRRPFRRGGILWIVRGGERIAGMLFDLRHRVVDAVALGVRQGDQALVREGAIAACYAHLVEHAQANGCLAVDLRGSRPSPLDGVTRYKRKWGAELYDRIDVVSTTLVHWNRLTPAVESLLQRLPLIFRDDGGLSVVGVAATATDLGPMRMPGLGRTILATSVGRPPHPSAGGDAATAPPQDGASPRVLLAAAARSGSI